MASPALQEHWPDLSGLGLPNVRNADSRAALLVMNAELFVTAPARDREIIETFESLALGFLPGMDHATLVTLARILSPCEDTPSSILDHLLRHSQETRDIVLGHLAIFPSHLVKQLFATAEGRLRLARHPALTSTTVDHLLVMHEDALDDVLAVNRSILATSPAMRELVRRARNRPSLGTILLARDGLTLRDEAALYLAADPERRRRIRDRMAPATADDALRLADYERAALVAAARASDVAHFEALLNYAFGFATGVVWRLPVSGRHELLSLALKAIGFGERDAIEIILGLHPAMSQPLSAVRRLVHAMREPSPPVAAALVRAILGDV
ncbi:hypothetical protein [Microvirga puerhi]|uniref:DUF2336 domain-containing protein n=1 Tax=Microvirga puerhi TaxID=2876078 RepID=A0ABS7VML1_9HYPH|nr:hypothetical protein [Microvirga puerhi]MBZ6076375.1 hypothetical protein [Microvirga puerhi]